MPTAQYPKPESEAPKKKNRPAAEFRRKNLRITIWASVGKDGITRLNSVISRAYQANGVWRETQYLGEYDLTAAKALINQAEQWIINLPGLKADITARATAA